MAIIAHDKLVQCYHCGQDCPDETFRFDEKIFCCEGCKTVYEILDASELCSYYDIEQTPGIRRKDSKSNTSFNYLDEPEIESKVLDFADDTIAKVTFSIPQIHCASCIHLLERLHQLNEGITHSRVNFLRREVAITYRRQDILLSKVVSLLDTIGYTPDLHLNITEKKTSGSGIEKAFYYRLGLAGFCFGNIMLFSFPEYLGIDAILESGFAHYFAYLNLLLALPVFLYSSMEFFRPAYLGLKAKHLNLDVPISLGILVLFSRSAFEILTHTGAGYMDSLAGLVFFLLIGKWLQKRTYHQLSFERDYKSYFPIAVTRITESGEQQVPLAQVQLGDELLVRNEEVIPADGIITNGNAQIDYSFVTGESTPIDKKEGDPVYAGGQILGASVQIKLSKAIAQSYLTQLWNDQTFQNDDTNQLSGIADKAAQYFTPAILLIALVSGIAWTMTSVSMAVQVFTAVLIIACPCALALSVPFTLGNAQRIMGRLGFYLKNTQVIEKLAKANTLVFDKTGTLTINHQQKVSYEGKPLKEAERSWVKSIVKQSNHPLSKIIYQSLEDGNDTINPAFYKETPGAGIEGLVAGHYIRLGKSRLVAAGSNSNEGTGSTVWLSIDEEVKGCFQIEATYRPELEQVINNLDKQYSISLISGDNDHERETLGQYFGASTPLHFNQTPHDKLNYIRDLQMEGHQTIMVGDGLNDAGALKQSDVGIAVSDDINNFSPACDAILNGQVFRRLPQLLRYSNWAVKLVYAAFAISLLYNLVGLGFAIQGLLSPLVAAILMPLSSITVVAFGTVATWLAARRITWNMPESDKGHPPF